MLKEICRHGEVGSANIETIKQEQACIKELLARFQPEDHWNVDKSALFAFAPPDCGLSLKQMSGKQANKFWITCCLAVTKLAGGLLFFPYPYLTLWQSLHYFTLLYSTLGRSFHYFTLLYSTLGQSFHYFPLLYITGDIILYSTLHVCALWWQVVISLSRLLCGIQPLWLCGPYHDLLCVWELLSCHSLSLRTVVTPFSILWESSMTCAVRTLCFSFMLTEQLYVCLTLHYPILYFLHTSELQSLTTFVCPLL